MKTIKNMFNKIGIVITSILVVINTLPIYVLNVTAVDGEELIEVSFNPEWSKTDDTVIATITVVNAELYSDLTYSIDEGIQQTSSEFSIEDGNEHKFCAFEAEVEIGCTTANAQFDDDAPTITDVEIDNDDWTKDEIIFAIIASDGAGSGIKEYQMDDKPWQTTPDFEVSDNQKHLFRVKDNVGNVSDDFEQTATKFDNVAPKITSITIDPSTWTNGKVTITVNATDEGIGEIEYEMDDDGEWETSSVFEVEDGEVHSFKVRDGLGNVSEPTTAQAQYETIKPIVTSITLSTTDQTNQPIEFTVNATDEGGSNIKDYQMDDGDWFASNVFEVEDAEEHIFRVRDNAGNISDVTEASKMTASNYDGVAPVIEDIVHEEWTNEDVVITIEATDDKDFVDDLVYQLDDNTGVWLSNNVFTISDALEHTIYVMDTAGNIAEQTFSVAYDTVKPTVESFEITLESGSAIPFNKLIHFMTFGFFYNETIKVTATAEDTGETDAIQGAAGVKEITFNIITIDEDGNETDRQETVQANANGEASITLPIDFVGVIEAKAKDNAGNIMDDYVRATQANCTQLQDGTAGFIMLENVKPTIEQFDDSADTDVEVKNVNNINVYNGDSIIDIKVTDDKSGLYSVDLKVNGVSANDFPKSFTAIDLEEIYSMNTSEFDTDSDGLYEIELTVIDNAGNEETDSLTIARDMLSPIIKGFDFNLKGSIDLDLNSFDLYDVVEIMDYGFYFKKDVTVTIKAEELLEVNGYISGVDTISYKAINIDGLVCYSGTKKVNSNNEITFDINSDFKGQIYAMATDNVKNNPNNSNLPNNYDQSLFIATGDLMGYVHPNGSILESSAKHLETSSIEISVPISAYKQGITNLYNYTGSAIKDKYMDYAQITSAPLFAADTSFGIKVDDTYSGIRELKWTIIESGVADVERSIQVSKDGTLSGDTAGWIKTNEVNTNLVIGLENNSIAISGNHNDMVILVELTDRAGNVSYDYYMLGIDKVKPTINITFDKTPIVKGANEFYNEVVTATVVITERNFNSEDVKYSFKDASGTNFTLDNFVSSASPFNDSTTHTTTVTFSNDQEYTLDISYNDLAGNAADSYATEAFIVDLTKPEISVTYDNNSALNTNYYKEDRIATISIKEVNFEPNDVKVTGTANNDGNAITFPATSAWSSSGDTHTATIHYSDDAFYTFTIEYTDLAENMSEAYKEEEFYVDKTIPTLEITGVEDKSANKGDVIPVIIFSDINYDESNVSVQLYGANRKNITELDGYYSAGDHGQIFTFNNFTNEKDFDDLYTLTANITDLAGNEEELSIQFSVNRFGSVYIFSDELKQIEGKYVQNEIDVVITEINVDSLIHESINLKMTKNGSPKSLTENTDYTVLEIGGDTAWSEYTYRVNKTLFSGDGKYAITLYSEDIAGNINENIDETKEAQIEFGIDKTAPAIVVLDIESNAQYALDSKPVSITVKDNLVLNDVKVSLNGQPIEYTNSGDSYKFVVDSSNSKQSLQITATDAAGNETVVEVKDFLVTTSMFVRWYNNTPLFYGSIAGVTGSSVAIASYVFRFRKRKLMSKKV